MDRWQPYLYEPQRQSVDVTSAPFNPKAVTMASRQPPSPKKKQEGPLLNFNKHPDSYLVLPYGKTDAKPLHRSTKAVVKIVRWVQLFLRVCNLLGAVGVLLCGIFIRGAMDSEGYIMRIPPGVDIVVCLYAIYHLIRNAKSRPAGSSASYHFFALVTDAGFIPFYVFTVLMSRRNSDMEPGSLGRWRTTFPTDDETNIVLKATWLTAVSVAGLHLASLFLDLYLVVVFRKITRLPPDMNPLEDNLTSRRKSKHKHKSSSLSTTATLTGDKEKRFSAQSTIAEDRNSQVDPLISKDIPSPDKNQVAFMHTRTNSNTAYSPHTPHSARQSRERFSMYSQPQSVRHSRQSLNHRDDLQRRPDFDDTETLAQRKSFLAQQANIKRHSRADSYINPSSTRQEFYTPPATAQPEAQEATGDLSLQRNSRETLQQDNWFVYPEHDGEPEQEEHYPAPPSKPSMFNSSNGNGYGAVNNYDDVSDLSSDEDDAEHYTPAPLQPQSLAPSPSPQQPIAPEPTARQPLRMNPPTPPPPAPFTRPMKSSTPPPTLQRTLTTTSMSTDATFNRSVSRSGTPKTRYYGDLRAATQGIRAGAEGGGTSPGTSPTKHDSFKRTPNHLPSATKQYAVNSPAPPQSANAYATHAAPSAKQTLVATSPFSLNKKTYSSVRRTGEANYTPVQSESPRVVSRSGVDYMHPYDTLYDHDADLASSAQRRREVSGKVAEEGRGGNWMSRGVGLVQRKVSGVV